MKKNEIKTWAKAHKKQIFIGSAIAVSAALSIAYIVKNEREKNELSAILLDNSLMLAKTFEDKSVLMAAASEGLFNEAIAGIKHKLSYREDLLDYMCRRLDIDPADSDAQKAKPVLESEIGCLKRRLEAFEEAHTVWNIDEQPGV